MKEFKEHDSVVSTRAYPDIPVGTQGVIVYIYDVPTYMEVEFFVNNTSIVQTVTVNAIKHSPDESKQIHPDTP